MRRTIASSATQSPQQTNPTLPLLKDTVLDRLAQVANVAQFVSFDPHGRQRHARIRAYDIDYQYESVGAAARALLNSSGSVNVRSFEPDNAKSREFVYGLTNEGDVISQVSRLGSLGLYTIINETIDVNDGGVSGVALGNLIEFAPGDTPRCVEKPGTASLPREMGLRLLATVYGFWPELSLYPFSERIEFSIHPIRRGIKNEHTIVWEKEEVGSLDVAVEIRWPNRFSRFVGDKAFGLLLGSILGLPVPRTTVFPRLLPPFSFGQQTGSGETWIRTCPFEQDPGRFTTHRGWLDPFKVLADEDPSGTNIASVLAQESVNARFSGSLIVEREGGVVVQGVSGFGEQFMLGRAIELLPKSIEDAVLELYSRIAALLGPVSFEWVHDGETVWIVQLHKGATVSQGNTIFPGEPAVFHRFEMSEGIDALRQLILSISDADEGVIVSGEVGITSHLGDLLRKARIPSRIEVPRD